MSYRVVGKSEDDEMEWVPEYRRHDVKRLMDEFGLWGHVKPIEVYHKWSSHSSSMAAGWLIPDKSEVEQVLGVSLEEDVT